MGLGIGAAASAQAGPATVLYNDQVTTVGNVLPDPNDLWVSPEELTRVNGFVLKPEGACLDDICIPIKQTEDSELFVTRAGKKWINLTRLARKLQQAFVVDRETNTWSFGEVPSTRTGFLKSAQAPDFSLADRSGKTVRLSDFRGKKVMIVTWASW